MSKIKKIINSFKAFISDPKLKKEMRDIKKQNQELIEELKGLKSEMHIMQEQMKQDVNKASEMINQLPSYDLHNIEPVEVEVKERDEEMAEIVTPVVAVEEMPTIAICYKNPSVYDNTYYPLYTPHAYEVVEQ